MNIWKNIKIMWLVLIFFCLLGCEELGLYQSPLALFEEVAIVPPETEFFHANYVVKKIHKDRRDFIRNYFSFYMSENNDEDCNFPPDAKIIIRLKAGDRMLIDAQLNLKDVKFASHSYGENGSKSECGRLGFIQATKSSGYKDILMFNAKETYSDAIVEILCECKNLKNRTMHVMLMDNSVTARQKMYEKETGKKAPWGYGMDSL